LAEDDQPTDIKPAGHFATRQSDRGDSGLLIRLFESLDEAGRKELLRYAQSLAQPPKTP